MHQTFGSHTAVCIGRQLVGRSSVGRQIVRLGRLLLIASLLCVVNLSSSLLLLLTLFCLYANLFLWFCLKTGLALILCADAYARPLVVCVYWYHGRNWGQSIDETRGVVLPYHISVVITAVHHCVFVVLPAARMADGLVSLKLTTPVCLGLLINMKCACLLT